MFKTDFNELFIVIPAKDEERFIKPVIETTLALGFTNIVIVNDNSSDGSNR